MLCTRPHARASKRSLTAEARLALRRRVAWPSIPRHAHQFCLGFATKSFQSLHAGHVQKGALVLRNSGGARGDERSANAPVSIASPISRAHASAAQTVTAARVDACTVVQVFLRRATTV